MFLMLMKHLLFVSKLPPVIPDRELSESCCFRKFNIIILICTLIKKYNKRKNKRTLNYLEKSQFTTGLVNFACLAIAQKLPLKYSNNKPFP